MPKIEKYDEGTPSYVELLTPDQHASAAFYEAMFGWEIDETVLEGDLVYVSGAKDGSRVCGISPLMPGMEGHPAFWGVYLSVDDVDDTAAKVVAAGGRLDVEPFDVMSLGRMASIADPTGARVNLWQAKDMIGTEIANEEATPLWNECVTPDPVAALGFYGDILGMTAEEMDMGEMGIYRILITASGRQVAGLCEPQPGMVLPPHWNTYFGVQDVDAAAALASELGGSTLAAPFDVPGVGRMAMMADPQGALFWVMRGGGEASQP